MGFLSSPPLVCSLEYRGDGCGGAWGVAAAGELMGGGGVVGHGGG